MLTFGYGLNDRYEKVGKKLEYTYLPLQGGEDVNCISDFDGDGKLDFAYTWSCCGHSDTLKVYEIDKGDLKKKKEFLILQGVGMQTFVNLERSQWSHSLGPSLKRFDYIFSRLFQSN